MTVETWGLIPKAQDNPQTIDEAIASAIAVHEAEPTAHLGDGESIDVHRKNTTLDHPAGSVVSDKVSSGQILISHNFPTNTGFNWSGYRQDFIFPGTVLFTNTTLNNVFVLSMDELPVFEVADITKNMLFQVTCRFNNFANANFELNFGAGQGDDGIVGFGFYTVAGTLYGYYNNGITVTNISLATLSLYKLYTLRAVYNPETVQLDFFVDEAKQGSLDFTTPDGANTDLPLMFYGQTKTTGQQVSIYLANLFISHDI